MSDAEYDNEQVRTHVSDEPGDEQDELVREPLPSPRPRRFWRAPRTLAALREPGPAAHAFSQRRRLLLTAALLLVVLLAGGIFGLVQHFSPQVVYARVTLGNLTVSVPATGLLQSAVYDTNFAGSGSVAEIDVAVGDTVTQGETLAKLDTTQLKDTLSQAQATLSAAQTKSDDANANLNKVQAQTTAQLTVAYDQEQSDISHCPANDSACVQTAQDTYAAVQATTDNQNAAAQAAVNEAQAGVSVAQAAVQTAQDNLNGAVLTAPHDGTVAEIYGSVGSAAGKSDTPFIRIADLGALQIMTNVSVANITGVQKGQDVTLTVPAAGKQTFHGSVTSVSPAGQVSGGVLYYPVLVDVDMNSVNGANLLPGMSAHATIITSQAIGVDLVPASAVHFAAAAGDPKHGGFLSKKQVTTALRTARDLLTALENQGNLNSQVNPIPAYLLQYTNGTWVTVPVVLGLTDGTNYELLQGPGVGTRIVAGQTNSPVKIPTPTPVVTH